MQGRSLISFSTTLVLPSIEWVTVVPYSNWNLLVYLAVCCPIVESSSPTAGRESWFMVLPVSGSQSFQACHREVCHVLICLSYIPVKCLSLWRMDYMPMQMTPHYWQLLASQQTDLLLLPLLTGTWLGFRSGAITSAWFWILTKQCLALLLYPGLWSLHRVTCWSRRFFLFALVSTSTSLAWSFTASSPSKNMCDVRGIVSRVYQRIGILRLVKRVFVGTPVLLRCYYAFVLPIFQYCSPVWGLACCWMSPSSSRWPGVFGRGKVFYGQEPPSLESTTPECGVNYQLLAVMLLK